MPEPEMLGPERIEAVCLFCESTEVFIIDFIVGSIFPLPDIFAVECKRCGHTGSSYQDSRGWKTEWSTGIETAT